jgi:hypothetical protein
MPDSLSGLWADWVASIDAGEDLLSSLRLTTRIDEFLFIWLVLLPLSRLLSIFIFMPTYRRANNVHTAAYHFLKVPQVLNICFVHILGLFGANYPSEGKIVSGGSSS